MENGLDIRELERLVEAYYACGLSREDEDCLRRVLVATGLRSEAIDRCRLAMGLEVVMGNDASAHVSKKHRRLRFLSVAASVAVAIGIGVTVLATWHRSSMGDRLEAVVYINGTRVTDDAYARAIAEKERQECIAMMMEVVAERIATAGIFRAIAEGGTFEKASFIKLRYYEKVSVGSVVGVYGHGRLFCREA